MTVDGRLAASLSRLILPFCFIYTKAHSLGIGSQLLFTLNSVEWHMWLKALGFLFRFFFLLVMYSLMLGSSLPQIVPLVMEGLMKAAMVEIP